MAEQSNAAGSIYDLGYRPYAGERRGRGYAFNCLLVYSLRMIFGLGRSALSKLFPIGLAVLALLPATVQLAIAAISPLQVEIVKPADYFSYVQIILALFCAVVTPELIGRDQRARTLPLYFSRALSRFDYVSAKLAALAAALFAVQVLPQFILFLGSALTTQDVLTYIRDDAGRLPPIFASALVVSVFMASLSLAIASQTPRRAFATGAVLAYFVIFTLVGTTLVQTISGDARTASLFISPVDILEGVVRWLFGAEPQIGSDIEKVHVAGGYMLLAAIAYSGAAMAVLYRRFLRMSV